MSMLHVLLPSLRDTGNDSEWRAWLRRGDRLADVQDARITVVRERFQFAGGVIPAAALRHLCHVGDAGNGIWLCADPAYVRSEATGARLMACPVNDLSATDADELAAALQPLFEEMAGALLVDTPSTWCLHLTNGPSRAAFTDPAAALGASLADGLPEGQAGRAWRRLFNEAQILLHAHPANARRAAAGKVPVNALWFWGEGSLPAAVETGLHGVASADDVLRGLAKMSGAVRLEPLPQAVDAAGGNGDVLLDLDIPGQNDAVAAWLPSFRRWLRERRFRAIELAFASGERHRVQHLHGLRFWRRG